LHEFRSELEPRVRRSPPSGEAEEVGGYWRHVRRETAFNPVGTCVFWGFNGLFCCWKFAFLEVDWWGTGSLRVQVDGVYSALFVFQMSS
jgi:hypothetical protein